MLWPPSNPYTYRGTYYWFELAPILRRNVRPWHDIRINFYPTIWPDIVTIMCWQLPMLLERNKGWQEDGSFNSEHLTKQEIEAHAVVCNMGWLGGECPYDSAKAEFYKDKYGKDTVKVKRRPIRGVREGVQVMVSRGVLRRSVEVGLLLNDYEMVREAWGNDGY